MDQQLRFCTTTDGVRIAYATVGSGPALMVARPGPSHLELEWEEPRVRDFWETIARHHTLVLYDKHGYGLSDRERKDFSLDSEVRTLEAVVKELGLRSFMLWATAHVAALAVAYAVKFPTQVSHLILYGAQARWHGGLLAHPNELPVPTDQRQDTYRELMLLNWPMASLAQVETMLGSSVDAASQRWFLRIWREGAPAPEILTQLMVAHVWNWDVRNLLSKVSIPTLVLHYRNDRFIPFEAGRELAAGIPGARFVPLEGDAHVFYFSDTRPLRRAVAEFLGDPIEEVSQPSTSKALEPVPPEANPGIFRKDGEFWTIACCGESFHLKDTKGLAYIAQLLRHPRQEIHVLSLAAESDGDQVLEDQEPNEESLMMSGLTLGSLSDAGEMLDSKAKAAYRRRLAELESQLQDARESGNSLRADKIADEKEVLTAELARAVGLSGRDRRASSAGERARINVTRAIKVALDRMANQSPATAALLTASIRTGSFCCYTPDPRLPTVWNL